MNFAWRLYRRLAQAFPHEFKLAYGAEVMQLGEDVWTEIAKRRGVWGLMRLLADFAIRVPLEYLSEMRGDLRYAWRGLVNSPGFALVGIISLGLGMGLTTTVYNSKWLLISRQLPAAANARRLVMPEKPLSYYYIEQYRNQKSLFAGVAAFQTGVPFNVTFQGEEDAPPQRVYGQLVSPDYFSVLGVRSQRGRMLSADLDRPGDAPVVVISDRFWRNRLNSSSGAVGQRLRLNGQPATIVGIAPKDFNGVLPTTPSELFVPITAPAALAPELAGDVLHRRNAREFLALLCLAPGASVESAEARMDAITRHLDELDASAPPRADKGRRITLVSAGSMVPLPPQMKFAVAGFLFALMGLIMAIACMNLANMLLARGANRRKELAIRLSVGASRFRLIRQMISEGILLSLLGGVAGFALACGLSVLRAHFAAPTPVPEEVNFLPDWRAAIFVFTLAVVCGIGFSLAPALRSTKADLTPALKARPLLRLRGRRRVGLRSLLMVAQFAGSLTLLLITGFLVIGLSQVSSVRTRFDPHTMFLLSLDPVREGYTPERAQALFTKIPGQFESAGVARRVALAAQVPYSVEDEDAAIPMIAQDSPGAPRVGISAVEETVGAGYFAALGEPILAGREFTEDDQRIQPDGSKALLAVLNETAARAFFAAGNTLGRRFSDDRQSYEVAGVVPDLKNGAWESQPVVYLPLTQRNFAHPPADGITILVRSDAGTETLDGIRRALARLDPRLTPFHVRTLSDYLQLSRSSQAFAVGTYGGMGIFGLVLAAVGLAGVTACAVAQRRKEIGIRMALGARQGQMLRLVLREAAALAGAGTVLGFLGAFVLAKMLSALTQVFAQTVKAGTDDPRLLVGAPLLLAAAAMLACYLPARRSAKIDPLRALREE